LSTSTSLFLEGCLVFFGGSLLKNAGYGGWRGQGGGSYARGIPPTPRLTMIVWHDSCNIINKPIVKKSEKK
jgi:hypothetical protein